MKMQKNRESRRRIYLQLQMNCLHAWNLAQREREESTMRLGAKTFLGIEKKIMATKL